jgi:sugar/nucleoside kinase (ribokinase family)
MRLGVGTAPDAAKGLLQGGCVIIRAAALGAYVCWRGSDANEHIGRWVDAYWTSEYAERVVDVTGAGNAFLGGLAAGLELTGGDVYQGEQV